MKINKMAGTTKVEVTYERRRPSVGASVGVMIGLDMIFGLTLAAPSWGAETGKLSYPDPVSAESPSFGVLLLRMVLALVVVVGLALILSKVLPRLVPNRVQGRWIRVIGQTSLGQNKSLVLAEILGKVYVLAVTDHQITRLLDEKEIDLSLVREIADGEKAKGLIYNNFTEDKFRRLLATKLADFKQHFGNPGKMG